MNSVTHIVSLHIVFLDHLLLILLQQIHLYQVNLIFDILLVWIMVKLLKVLFIYFCSLTLLSFGNIFIILVFILKKAMALVIRGYHGM